MKVKAVPSSGTTTSHGCLEASTTSGADSVRTLLEEAYAMVLCLVLAAAVPEPGSCQYHGANFARKLACVPLLRACRCPAVAAEFVARRFTQLALVCFLRDKLGSSVQGFLHEMRESLAVNKITMPSRADERVRSPPPNSTLEGWHRDNHLECARATLCLVHLVDAEWRWFCERQAEYVCMSDLESTGKNMSDATSEIDDDEGEQNQ